MQFTFGDKREVNLLGESALPVTTKESGERGKQVIKKHKYTTNTELVLTE